MKLRPLFLVISIILLTSSVLSIIFWGFKPSIDFTGGAVWELNSTKINEDNFKEVFTQNQIELKEFNNLGNNNYSLKFIDVTLAQKEILNTSLKEIDTDIKELKFESVGAILGRELLKKTIFAVILTSLFLFLFIGRRFRDFSFGTSAVLAMLHDTLILMGSFSVLGHFFGAQLDSLFVTAILTTLSSSVHDTVVTFDRIRELKKQTYQLDWVKLSNQAVTETLTRSINNSMTIIFMLTSLVFLGGDTTRWFATALLIGVICGTYSSIGVAIPLVIFFKKHLKKK
ncbi:MAG: protein translocase subunit SecF [Candidatus Shapirobacteria bacterium]|jgi:preprotein translocase subunit SecF|nr:protein translocase subunit SecF [Candidatus Shapirobacteria bacterium]